MRCPNCNNPMELTAEITGDYVCPACGTVTDEEGDPWDDPDEDPWIDPWNPSTVAEDF